MRIREAGYGTLANSIPQLISIFLDTTFPPSHCPQHGRTLVWTKNTTRPGGEGWCQGSPVGGGYVISSGSVLESFHEGQSSAPFDVLCREKCEAHGDCQ